MIIGEDIVRTKSILVLIKGALDSAVPIVGIARHLSAMGHCVQIASSTCSSNLKKILSDEKIIVTSLDCQSNSPSVSSFKKILKWAKFRDRAVKLLRKMQPDLVYIGSADTAISLIGVLSGYRYVLHLRELHDKEPAYMRALEPIARRASRVVVPETNRSFIYASLLGLERKPLVLPNKTYEHPRERRMPIDFLPIEMQNTLMSYKILLYQGLIHIERDLRPLLRAISNCSDYKLLLMGKDYNFISAYELISRNFVHIPFISPPQHLNVTSWAHIGVISYDTSSLNTIYCAPNKIWEFSGFGLPMLCSENPGLKCSVGNAGAAESIDMSNQALVELAIKNIETDYMKMSKNADMYFDSIDIGVTLSNLMAEIS